MRLKSVILFTTSAAALGLATPAVAQDQTAPPAGTGGQAQESPADPGVDEAAEGEEIIVTGFRESIASAQNIRRNSDQIVDAIVAEDIGKLPDIAVSDTAARIPGVQVERGGGEAGRVLVRGLPDYTTTYNGREIFTAETRTVALQDFPAGLIGAIEVFKTSTANLIEPGLAGLVNVRSRRPFDFDDGLHIGGSAWGLYTYQSDSITPNGNITISNRWDLGDGGEIGALIGFSYTRLKFLDSERSNTDFVAGGGPNGTRFPDVQRAEFGSGDRERPSLNAAIQYRPNPDLELYVEGLWQGFRNKVSSRGITVPLWGGTGFTDVETVDGRPDLLEGATVTGAHRPDGFQGGTFNKTDTYQVAFGGSYDAGPLKISADVAHTDSTFTGSTASVDFAFDNLGPCCPRRAVGPGGTVTFDGGNNEEDGVPTFDFQNFDATNEANYIYRGFYEEAQQARGKDWQGRVDVSYETDWSALREIQFGVRYTDRQSHAEFGSRYFGNDPVEDQRIRFSQVPLDYELFTGGFRGADVGGFRSWLTPTYESIRENIGALRQFTQDIGGTAFTLDDPTPDPLRTWDISEKSFAAYGQLRFDFPLGGDASIDGNIGLRYVKNDLSLSGTQLVLPAGGGPGVLTPVDQEREFEDWLPNINARIRFTPQFQARLAYTQTRTRPNFIDLRPSGQLDQPPSCLQQNPIPESCFQTASGGNPYLNPLLSDNYDAALEYYFSRTGFLSLSVFHREMEGFIESSVFQGLTPSGLPLRLTGPTNSGAGTITGFELQATTFFDFVGLPQFGVQANLTNLDAYADFNYDATPPGAGTQQFATVNRELLGVSDWSANLIGIYEAGGLSARLAYNWRSEFPLTYQRRGDHLYTEEAEPVSRLDLSLSYDIMESLTLFGDWTNILGDPFRSTLTRIDTAGGNGAPTGFEATYPRVVRWEETTLSAGIRFRF